VLTVQSGGYLVGTSTFQSKDHGDSFQRVLLIPFVDGASGAQLFMRVMATMLRGRIAADQESAVAR
jgi:hypothetical protein